jgi:hypothetical protein
MSTIPLSFNRKSFDDTISKSDISMLVDNPDVKYLQTSEAKNRTTFELLDENFFSKRPDVQLRMFGYYSSNCDLSLIKNLKNIERFSADCLREAKNIESIITLPKLIDLSIGIFKLDNFDFLDDVNENITGLSLQATLSKKPKIKKINRFKNLKQLYLEGQQNGIESICDLKQLEEIVLRSISTMNLEYLNGLNNLWSVDIKLGGIKDFNDLTKLKSIKYLEIWQVLKFENIEFISELKTLQNLFLQSLPLIKSIPHLSKCVNLRRIYLENMKSLKDLSGIKYAKNLEEFIFVSATKQEIEDILPVLDIKKLKKSSVHFGSDKKNQMIKKIIAEKNIEWYSFSNFKYM